MKKLTLVIACLLSVAFAKTNLILHSFAKDTTISKKEFQQSKKTIISLGNKIGVIEIRGVIANSKPILNTLDEYRKNSSIKGILLRIESPGGGVGPSQEIYREVVRVSKTKPVLASLGGIAASGGYYIAAGAKKIVANPGTLTGSIGVIINFGNFTELFKKIGYKPITIKSGKFKDIGNPGREMKPEEKEYLEKLVKNVHEQFVNDVAKGRKLPVEKVKKIADGRIFTGQQAKELGLVDELGNFQDAVKELAKMAKIKGEPKLVYPTPKRRGVIDILFDSEVKEWFREQFEGYLMPLRYQFILPNVND